jgi:hypothetical protein
LGAGLTGAALRVTLWDGDSAKGQFNFNESTILVNGVNFGNVSSVAVQQTNSLGTSVISSGVGFRNELLDTGWFSLTDSTALATLFSSLSTGTATFEWTDSQIDRNILDFTQGVDGGLINSGSGPTVNPPTGQVALPGTLALVGVGLLASLRKVSKR